MIQTFFRRITTWKANIGWFVAAIIFLVYVPMMLYLLNFPSVFPVYGDGLYYVTLAGNILHHGVFSGSVQAPFVPATFIMPAYPLFLAIFIGTFGSYTLFPLVQLVLAGATSFLIFKIGERVFSYSAGVIAALLFILDPTTIFHSLIIMTDIPYVFLLVLSVYLLFFDAEGTEEGAPVRTFFAGIFFGVAMLTRVISMFLPIVIIPLYFLIKNNRISTKKIIINLFILTIAYSAVVVPWVARNNAVSGVWGIANEKSLNVFQYYVPEFLSYTRGISADEGRNILMEELRRDVGVSSSETIDIGSLEYAPAEEKIAFRYIREDFWGYAKFHLIKMVPFFLSSQIKNSLIFYNNALGYEAYKINGGNMTNLLAGARFKEFWSELQIQPVVTLEQLFWLLISSLAFVGAVFSGRKYHVYAILFVVLIFYFAVLTGPLAYSRFRLPSAPFLFLFAAYGT
ncbi:MAG: glycosyltransferase family 39 protein [Patescibacteria group bacterium]